MTFKQEKPVNYESAKEFLNNGTIPHALLEQLSHGHIGQALDLAKVAGNLYWEQLVLDATIEHQRLDAATPEEVAAQEQIVALKFQALLDKLNA